MKKTTTTTQDITSRKSRLSGVVTSDKMKDTVTVLVNRFVKHPKYGKYIHVHKKYKAVDVGNTKKVGDKVTIESCRKIAKTVYFKVI